MGGGEAGLLSASSDNGLARGGAAPLSSRLSCAGAEEEGAEGEAAKGAPSGAAPSLAGEPSPKASSWAAMTRIPAHSQMLGD